MYYPYLVSPLFKKFGELFFYKLKKEPFPLEGQGEADD
ncbi:MAG: hypothetical protein JWQ34_1801 [Mucilaginibacter sp.]|nr:hypothetical protein [Mucilaginibacter sp.]